MAMARHGTAQLTGTPVTVQGGLAPPEVAAAEATVARLARYAAAPILHARIRITRVADPAVTRPVIAQGNLDVNGRIARAQVAAGTLRQALGLLHDRLRYRLVRTARHWEARRGQVPHPAADEWRHGQPPAARPAYRSRPVHERQVVQRKTYAPTPTTVDDAAVDMELLDYDFYLFSDAGTGQDAVIYRAPPTGYRLAGLTPPGPPGPPPAVPLTVSPQPAPQLDLAAAVERLSLAGTPFLFYADAASGRGHLLYRRYDGHYGLVTPADPGR
jgi:hypothetical protein